MKAIENEGQKLSGNWYACPVSGTHPFVLVKKTEQIMPYFRLCTNAMLFRIFILAKQVWRRKGELKTPFLAHFGPVLPRKTRFSGQKSALLGYFLVASSLWNAPRALFSRRSSQIRFGPA